MFSALNLQTDIELLARVRQVGQQIGRTSLHHIKGVFSKKGVNIFVKKEWEQLSGSVKARPAYQIISKAIHHGALHRGKILLDATSGNTGIAYAAIAKQLGVKVTLCLPENASAERKYILKSLGANIIYTSKFDGTDGAQEEARALAASKPELYFYADQYKNEENWMAHFEHTAVEIFSSLPAITHFVAGLGTTGTFTGTGRRLKTFNPAVQLVALQPDSALHGLEGWKHLETAVVPGIYDDKLADSFLEIDTAEAHELIKAVKKHEGLLISPSAAGNLLGAIKVAEKTSVGVIATVFPDNADKYGDVIKSIF